MFSLKCTRYHGYPYSAKDTELSVLSHAFVLVDTLLIIESILSS